MSNNFYKELADKLDEAATLIEGGWCKNDLSKEIRGNQHYCALGAIVEVAAINERSRMMRALIEQINHNNIEFWNDNQTDKRPVVRAFRKAAERMRELGE